MDPETNKLTESIIGAAMEVHRQLGPGILENGYQKALIHELTLRGHLTQCEIYQPLIYKGLKIPNAYRIDILVDDTVILELKTVDSITDIHKAQLLTYLKMSGKELGLLLNFKTPVLKHGIRRIINTLPNK